MSMSPRERNRLHRRTWETVMPDDFGVTPKLTSGMVRALRIIATMGDVSYQGSARRGLGITVAMLDGLIGRGICEHTELPQGSGETTRAAVRISEWGNIIINNTIRD